MPRSSFAIAPCAFSHLLTRRRRYRPNVESLEDRRLLSVNGLSAETYQLLVDYFRAVYSNGPPPQQSLESLLNRDVEPIVECPGLHDDYCLPDTVSSGTVDAAMGSDVGLDDDWFSIDSGKGSLLGDDLSQKL